MAITFEQIAMMAITLWALNKYLDYKVETWMEYYLHHQQQYAGGGGMMRGGGRMIENFSPLSPAQMQAYANDTRFYRSQDGEVRDNLSCLPRGPYTQNLEPLYAAGVQQHSNGLQNQEEALPPWQDRLASAIHQPTQAVMSLLNPSTGATTGTATGEPERAACVGQVFQPISSPDVPYTTSLRPMETPSNNAATLQTIAPLSADCYPAGMSGGIHETQLLDNNQLVSRSRRRDSEVHRYMQDLDEGYNHPAESLLPFTKQWTA